MKRGLIVAFVFAVLLCSGIVYADFIITPSPLEHSAGKIIDRQNSAVYTNYDFSKDHMTVNLKQQQYTVVFPDDSKMFFDSINNIAKAWDSSGKEIVVAGEMIPIQFNAIRNYVLTYNAWSKNPVAPGTANANLGQPTLEPQSTTEKSIFQISAKLRGSPLNDKSLIASCNELKKIDPEYFDDCILNIAPGMKPGFCNQVSSRLVRSICIQKLEIGYSTGMALNCLGLKKENFWNRLFITPSKSDSCNYRSAIESKNKLQCGDIENKKLSSSCMKNFDYVESANIPKIRASISEILNTRTISAYDNYDFGEDKVISYVDPQESNKEKTGAELKDGTKITLVTSNSGTEYLINSKPVTDNQALALRTYFESAYLNHGVSGA